MNGLKQKFENFKTQKRENSEDEFYEFQEDLKKLNKLVEEFDQVKYEVLIFHYAIFIYISDCF